MVHRALPEDVRKPSYRLDAKGISGLLAEVAERHPDKYAAVAKRLSDLGRRLSWEQGETLRFEDLAPIPERPQILKEMEREIEALRKQGLDPDEFRTERQRIWIRYSGLLQKTVMEKGRERLNSLTLTAASGARGKPAQIQAMLAGPGIYQDGVGNIIDRFVGRSYSEGLRPADWLSATYGSRSSVISTKKATAKGGDFCLHEDTMVQLADKSVKPIREITVGDMVLGVSVRGKCQPTRVSAVFNQGSKRCHAWEFRVRGERHGIVEVCTKDHKFLFKTPQGNKVLPIETGASSNWSVVLEGGRLAQVRRLHTRGDLPCWDIEVEHPDHLFLLASGIVTSNSKQLVQIGATLPVTEVDCGTDNGIDLPSDSPLLRRRVLARPFGGLEAGTVVDRKALGRLSKKEGVVLVRSPLTCRSVNGVCAKCAGAGERFQLPKVGESVGITRAQSIGEPITQAGLNCLEDNELVRMADMSVKPIKEIQVGDWVLGSDINARTFPVRVTAVWDQGLQPVMRRTFSNGPGAFVALHLTSTSTHVVLGRSSGTMAKLPVGDVDADREIVGTYEGVPLAFTLQGSSDLGLLPCRDISVDHPDELFVLANGLIVKNSKHTGGQVGAKKEYSGLGWIDQFVQAPEDFPDRQVLAEEDGTVEAIKPAPQGGTYITVGGIQHYVQPGLEVSAKVGDTVERGTPMSSGLASPSDMLRLRGLGEARRYYAERFKKLMDDSGMETDQLHTETLARAALSRVSVRNPEGLGDLLPDDIVNYERLVARLPGGGTKVPAAKAGGKYLASGALHYTVGTRLSPSMIKRLENAGFGEVEVTDEPPEFETSMTRLRSAAHDQDDWLAQMHTSYLKSNIADSATRGLDTNVEANTHFAPRLAVGVGFGDKVRETGKF